MENEKSWLSRKTNETLRQAVDLIDIPATLDYAMESLKELPSLFEAQRQEFINALQSFHDNPPTKAELFSLPNGISLAGFLLVVNGCRSINTWAGFTQILIGRGADLIDGPVARHTEQTSETGAIVDAGLDKAGMFLILVTAWRADAIPKQAIAGMVGQNILSANITARHKLRDPEADLRPTKTGKTGMFIQNAAILTYLADNVLERQDRAPRLQYSLHMSAHALAATGIGIGTAASIQYHHRLPDNPFKIDASDPQQPMTLQTEPSCV